jgi:hypothetical protein
MYETGGDGHPDGDLLYLAEQIRDEFNQSCVYVTRSPTETWEV